ncbi:hypothetical protein SPFM12_00156 [Salmonella phage SPFM12]|nr:hypothetical protein SPFM12_00156 [Salmonella phage SPFM12]
MYIKDGSINEYTGFNVNEWNVQCNGERADNDPRKVEASELVTDVRLYASREMERLILLAKLYGLENSVLHATHLGIDGQRQGYALVAKAALELNKDLALAIEHMKNHQLTLLNADDVRRI